MFTDKKNENLAKLTCPKLKSAVANAGLNKVI